MDQVTCDICTKDYERTAVVPRVLSCGHTICSICITKVLRSASRCPICRVDLNLVLASTLPVNFSLLAILDSLKNTEPMNKHVKIRTLEDLDEELFQVKKMVRANMAKVSAQIKELEENPDSESADIKIQSVSERLDGVNLDARNNPFKGLKASMSIQLRDDETTKEFLDRIYSSIVSGELIYAVTIVVETIKYARLSAEDNRLMVHAFDTPVNNPHVKTVWFQVLKNSMRKCDLEAFLEVGNGDDDKRVIRISSTKSRTTPHIFSLFTGERGPTYKGMTFQTDTVHDYTNWILNIDELYNRENMCFEYSRQSNPKWTTAKDQLFVIGHLSGNLVICSAPPFPVEFPDVIGAVIEGTDHPKINLSDLKVSDSGLSVHVNIERFKR